MTKTEKSRRFCDQCNKRLTIKESWWCSVCRLLRGSQLHIKSITVEEKV